MGPSSALAWWLLDLSVVHALLLGAILTPTDPVVASSIVTGKLAEERVPEDVRHLISGESGANDGLGFLLLMLPVLLMEQPASTAVSEWLTRVLLLEVIGSVAAGAAFGFVVGKVVEAIYARLESHHGSLLSVALALSLLLVGATPLLHGDGILAVFAAGVAFNWVIREEEGHAEAQYERIQETLTSFFDLPVFMFFGMVLPWQAWKQLFGWPLVAFLVALLLFRRLPAVLLLRRFVAPLPDRRHAAFVGWFGPMAVAAMVYATWAKVKEGQEHIWHVASVVIFVSIVVHGVTATPSTRWLAHERQ